MNNSDGIARRVIEQLERQIAPLADLAPVLLNKYGIVYDASGLLCVPTESAHQLDEILTLLPVPPSAVFIGVVEWGKELWGD